jgi:2-methylcitrate dehydratase PrpD
MSMQPLEFIHDLAWADLPADIQHQSRRLLLDTLGAGLGGRRTPLSQIVYDFAATVYGGQGARLWADGRELSPPGAALATGMTIDALDIHDGHPLVKGHAGAAIVPAGLATLSLGPTHPISGPELLTSLVVGYEVALRAGLALHATACDYHTSGAWNALGSAALTARRLGLSPVQSREALGIAEYHGPRSQMMRCIDHPTMLKDGSGWGAMAGVSAGLLASQDFTGAPAVTVEADQVQEIWSNLGQEWQLMAQYFKPHAVCRWAQPAVEAALRLKEAHQFQPAQIRRLTVSTFHEATRLAHPRPASTEAAQYSLPFPVAAALVYGRLGPAELTGPALVDPQVLALAQRIELVEEPAFNDAFPARRWARLRVEMESGQPLDSGPMEARWDAVDPPTDQALREKFRWLAGHQFPPDRVAALEAMIWDCAALTDVTPLLALLAEVEK